MITKVVQLVKPNLFQPKYINIDTENKVLIRPECMALCHADQRYYLGKRSQEVLKKKLPMALIHECVGVVVSDPTGTFKVNQRVAMIPNDPPEDAVYRDGEYENYIKGVKFKSSGYDGFMQEIVSMRPDRVVAYDGVPSEVAAITEFISVAVHAVERTMKATSLGNEKFAIWGDGNLAYTTGVVLKTLYPEIHLTVLGKHEDKLKLFSFADKTLFIDQIPEDFRFEHGFECVGGEGTVSAINAMIDYALPQASITLMGVSENRVAINTRDILEKGITLVGSSRSGRSDFEMAVKILQNKKAQDRFKFIIQYEGEVKNIDDIHKIFEIDKTNPFKTVFRWGL